MSVEIRDLEKIETKQFVLVNGLPGIAYIGKLSVDYLIQQLKAKVIAEVYSKYFPPYVLIKGDGLVELLKTSDNDARLAAIVALGQIGEAAGTDALRGIQSDPCRGLAREPTEDERTRFEEAVAEALARPSEVP